jgi:Family of unknown function (DUF5946)
LPDRANSLSRALSRPLSRRRDNRGPPVRSRGVTRAPTEWTTCPGCGLQLPAIDWCTDGRLQNSPECWQVYTELVGRTMSTATPAGAVHQLSIDAYGAQHAGAAVAPISTVFSLIGLHLALDRGATGLEVRDAHQRLAALRLSWPRLPRPARTGDVTVFDVALADDPADQVRRTRRWAASVWAAWAPWHDTVRRLTDEHLSGTASGTSHSDR